MSKVFVVQIQKKIIKKNGVPKILPTFDLAPAERFGNIVELIPDDIAETDDEIIIRDHIYDTFQEQYEHGDYVLPVGAPVLIGVACAVLMEICDQCSWLDKKIKFLVWDRRKAVYEVKTYHI